MSEISSKMAIGLTSALLAVGSIALADEMPAKKTWQDSITS